MKENKIMNHRGIITISIDLIKTQPDKVLLMMEGMIVTRAEQRDFFTYVEYEVVCKDLPEVKPECMTPYYELIIDDLHQRHFVDQQKWR